MWLQGSGRVGVPAAVRTRLARRVLELLGEHPVAERTARRRVRDPERPVPHPGDPEGRGVGDRGVIRTAELPVVLVGRSEVEALEILCERVGARRRYCCERQEPYNGEYSRCARQNLAVQSHLDFLPCWHRCGCRLRGEYPGVAPPVHPPLHSSRY